MMPERSVRVATQAWPALTGAHTAPAPQSSELSHVFVGPAATSDRGSPHADANGIDASSAVEARREGFIRNPPRPVREWHTWRTEARKSAVRIGPSTKPLPRRL